MPLTIIPAIAAHIASAEAAMAPLDEHAFSAELDALVPNSAALTTDERRGCFAEIVGLRFSTTSEADRGPWELYFCPLFSGTRGDGTEFHAPDASEVDAEIVEYWKARSAHTPHPTLRARYADLAREIGGMWNKEHRGEPPIELPRELAQRAIGAYLEAVAMGLAKDVHQAWRFLDRALGLALLIKDTALVERSKFAAFTYNREQKASGGVDMWWMIDNLAWDRKGLALTDAERDELVGWLDEALVKFSNIDDPQNFEPHQSLEAADRLIRWYRKAGKPELGLAALKTAGVAFETFAKQANALTAIAWMEDLSVRYRQENLMDDASRVDAAIFARGDEAQQSMKLVSAPIEVPAGEMKDWLDELTDGSSKLALMRIAMHLMTSEDDFRRMVEENAANAPLHARISITIMDASGFTAATIGSVKDDMPGRILSAAATFIGASAPWLHQALEQAKSKWQIDVEALLAFLVQSPLYPPHAHGLLRAGLDAWFVGDFVKAVHVLVPQVEAALREMLKTMGESPMKPNSREGGFETLGMGTVLMTESFKTKVHPTFRLHLRALYTSPKGINLRNKLAHGLAGPDAFGQGMANWVVHTLLAIRTYGHLDE